MKKVLNSAVALILCISMIFSGAVVAFAVSMVAIKFLMNFVKSHNFKPFGYYRIALGIIVLATLVVPVVLA